MANEILYQCEGEIKGGERMNHLLNICKLNGAEVEPQEESLPRSKQP